MVLHLAPLPSDEPLRISPQQMRTMTHEQMTELVRCGTACMLHALYRLS